jgi:hypothetical protein
MMSRAIVLLGIFVANPTLAQTYAEQLSLCSRLAVVQRLSDADIEEIAGSIGNPLFKNEFDKPKPVGWVEHLRNPSLS